MADASDSSPYVLAAPDSSLPNSRTLLASGGLVIQDTGPERSLTVNTIGNLSTLNSYNSPGIVVYDTTSSPTFLPRQLVTGTGIAITNPAGQSGNPTISVTASSTVQNVNVLADAVSVSTRSNLNFKGDGAVSVTVGDNSLNNRADITISTPVAADVNAKYIIQTPDGGLPHAQALSTLATGLMKVTTVTGVVSHAVANTDYQAASANLTSISGITSNNGTLIVGNGTGYQGFPSGGDPGDVLTSGGSGNLPSWRAPATGNLVVVLPNPTTSQTLVGNTTYIAINTSGSKTIFTLPSTATAVAGTFYRIVGGNQIGWEVHKNSSAQLIAVGNLSTTLNGTIQSTTTGPYPGTFANDSIIIWCVAPTYFIVTDITGTINVT